MRLRSLCCVSAALAAIAVPADSLHAAPAATRVVAAAATPSLFWIAHEVVPGERLREIADRYAVSVGSILRWNRLDPRRPQFWVGEQLRIRTRLPHRSRHRVDYIVRPGDTYEKLAKRFSVDREALEKYWNPKEIELTPGHQLTIWVEPGTVVLPPDPEPNYPVVAVPAGAISLGWPTSGRLLDGVQIPDNPALYTIRNPEHAWGSTHAIRVLEQCISEFRTETGFDRHLFLWDMSRRRGGYFSPHHSHRSGRDIDIALPLRPGIEPGSNARGAVDYEATWHLIRAFVESGQVKYIFLSRGQQHGVYKAAKACGATPEELERIFQYPRTTRVGIVRHSPGHNGHLHVRFLCGSNELKCQDL